LLPSYHLSSSLITYHHHPSSLIITPHRYKHLSPHPPTDERSAAAGATNVVRSVGSSVAPYLAGLLYADPRHTSWPFFIAGCLKLTYDLLLMAVFSSSEDKGRSFWAEVTEPYP
jgi:hypothetical protein